MLHVSIQDAIATVYDAIEKDPIFLDRFLSKIDRKRIDAFLRVPLLADYPADVETTNISIWDNDFGKRVSKIEARYCVQVKANRIGNGNLLRPDFQASADLLTPTQIRKRAKRWGMTPAEQANFETVVTYADENNLLIGRLVLVVFRKGSHTFKSHYVLVADLHETPRVILYVPVGSFIFDADKRTDCKGKKFVETTKDSGHRCKVIAQSRETKSKSEKLIAWAKCGTGPVSPVAPL